MNKFLQQKNLSITNNKNSKNQPRPLLRPISVNLRQHFLILSRKTVPLKVPKRENFSLAFFALSEPIWVCDLGTGEKNRIFYQLTPDFDSFWFFAAH